MRVLITGGAGFIGSHIADFFQGKAEVRVLDNLRSGFKDNLNGSASGGRCRAWITSFTWRR
jgi:nucleoside-diphosphate-sugar epimerase